MKRQIMRNTPEEEAAIQRGIDADPDNPEWTDEDFKAARSAAEVLPAEFMAAARRPRGPQKAPTKQMVSIRLDHDVIEALRASGPGWQGRANDMLREALKVE
jgi:uncharacterized protein (DUF4415 family)